MDALELVKAIYAGFEAGDPSVALEHCTEQTTVEQDARLPWGGRYVGRDEVLRFFAKLVTTVDTRLVIDAIFQAGDDVVEIGRSVGTVRDSGVALDVPECHIWTIRDGLIHAATFYLDSEAALAALG